MLRRKLAVETAVMGNRRVRKTLRIILMVFFLVFIMSFFYDAEEAAYAFVGMPGIGGAENPDVPEESSTTTSSAIGFEGDVVSSGYEFLSWLDRNESSGGRMVLSSDISVYTMNLQEYFYPKKKITIDTAGYSITVKNGTFLNLNGGYSDVVNLEILGSGPNPLIIQEEGSILLLRSINIKTVGTNSNAIYKKGGEIDLHSSSIEVSGQGSTGIISEDSMELENVYISSSGPDSSAIRSRGSIYVFCGNLSALGNNSVVAVTSGSSITLDTSYIDPVVDGAIIICRGVSEDSHYSNLRQQILLNGKPSMPEFISLQLANVDYPGDIKEINVKIEWDTNGLDAAKTGEYEIIGKIMFTWDGITIHGDSFLKMKIYVKDPSVPDISFITMSDGPGKYFQVEFPHAIDNTEDIVLWRLDNNEQWYDYTANCDFISYGHMYVNNVEPEIPAYFKLEVRGNGVVKGFSDIIKIIIHQDDSYEVEDLGGDRDGGDRAGGKGGGYPYVGEVLRNAAKTAAAEKLSFQLLYMIYYALEKNMGGIYNALADLDDSAEIYAAEYSVPDVIEGQVVNSYTMSAAKNTSSKNGDDAVTAEHREEPSPEEQDILRLDAVEEQGRTKAQPFHSEETESGYKRDYIYMLAITAILLIGACFISAAFKRKWNS